MSTSKKKEYKRISKRVQELLALQENVDVEFKQSLGGVEASDIVAFANSEAGGAILAGVREKKSPQGRQEGEIVGCKVGDGERLSIINKAESCVPPIDVEIIVENLSSKPFFRIEISSGPNKPYCTSGGTYKIRGDGRTIPLLPSRLLTMFMDTESGRFLERFREATKDLEQSLSDTTDRVLEEINVLLYSLDGIEPKIDETLGHTLSAANKAESSANELVRSSDEALEAVDSLRKKLEGFDNYVEYIDEKLDVILKHLGLEDPYVTKQRHQFEIAVKAWRLGNEQGMFQVSNEDILISLKKVFAHMPEEQIIQWYEQIMEEIKVETESSPKRA